MSDIDNIKTSPSFSGYVFHIGDHNILVQAESPSEAREKFELVFGKRPADEVQSEIDRLLSEMKK